LIAPTLGETVFVSGLGLVGLIAIQLLRANGCKVLGADVDPTKCSIARHLGAEIVNLSAGEDPVAIANSFTQGRGVDAVLVAAATKSSSPIDQAAQMSRNRGRIVLVGVTGLDLKRSDFYEKELTFQVSRSYGPGRYDPDYEQRGNDYPLGFVRWTEQRNFDAVLSLMRSGALETDILISQRFRIDDAPHAYQTLLTASNVLGVLLEYPPTANEESVQPWTVSFQARPRSNGGVKPVIGVIGAGQYASRVVVPALRSTPARLKTIASGGGLSATIVGRKFGFESTTTDVDAILNDAEIDAVVIATQHDSHAQLVIRALEAGKSVFVEKPLALSNDEIDAVERAYNAASSRSGSPILMVGFNRRFSPLVLRMRDEISKRRVPFALVYTCNAGAIPPEHWTQREESGGGRIVGEACHFIDLARHLAGSPIQNISAVGLGGTRTQNSTDTASLQLSFKNGCIATIQYLANGHRTFPKERLEVFQDGRILALDNFRTLKGFGVAGLGTRSTWRQNKGQRECLAAFVEALATDGEAPIAADQIFEVSRVTVKLRDLVATAV
jgi:predicted dehydrogenase